MVVFDRKSYIFLIFILLFSRILHKNSRFRGYSFEETLKKYRKNGEFEKLKFEKSGVN